MNLAITTSNFTSLSLPYSSLTLRIRDDTPHYACIGPTYPTTILTGGGGGGPTYVATTSGGPDGAATTGGDAYNIPSIITLSL